MTLDQIGALFSDHDGRRVGVAADDRRHHRGIDDAQADEYLRAWLDDREGMTRNDVIDLVMLVFDSVAMCLVPSPA